MDLRKKYEKKAAIKNGHVYKFGNIVQVWERYEVNDIVKFIRETLVCMSFKDAEKLFNEYNNA